MCYNMKKRMKLSLVVFILLILISFVFIVDNIIAAQQSAGQSSGSSGSSSGGGVGSNRDANPGSTAGGMQSNRDVNPGSTVGSASGQSASQRGVSTSSGDGRDSSLSNSPSTCFVGETLVSVPNGFKKIKDIKEGDLVYSFDVENNKLVTDTVEKVLIHDGINANFNDYSLYPLMEIETSNHIKLKVTANHPFYYPKLDTWVNVLYIPIGEEILYLDNFGKYSKVKLVSKKILSDNSAVLYNFETNKYHNYLVNGILVHNGGSSSQVHVPTFNFKDWNINPIASTNIDASECKRGYVEKEIKDIVSDNRWVLYSSVGIPLLQKDLNNNGSFAPDPMSNGWTQLGPRDDTKNLLGDSDGGQNGKQFLLRTWVYNNYTNNVNTLTNIYCSTSENSACTVVCPEGSVISAVNPVRYGAAYCNNLPSTSNSAGSCSKQASSCIGQISCTWTFNNANCGDTCYGYVKTGVLGVTCTNYNSVILPLNVTFDKGDSFALFVNGKEYMRSCYSKNTQTGALQESNCHLTYGNVSFVSGWNMVEITYITNNGTGLLKLDKRLSDTFKMVSNDNNHFNYACGIDFKKYENQSEYCAAGPKYYVETIKRTACTTGCNYNSLINKTNLFLGEKINYDTNQTFCGCAGYTWLNNACCGDDTNENIPETGNYCNDYIDNDCDGLLDHNDPNCGGCPANTTLCPDGLCRNSTCNPVASCVVNGACDPGENCFCSDCWLKQDSCASGLICSNNISKLCYQGFCGDGICSVGESCSCSDCGGQSSVCSGGAVCDPLSKICVCPIGTTLCGDGTCKSNCNNQNTTCDLDGIPDYGESCTCRDSHYYMDSCLSGSVCDPKTNVCKCEDGKTLCSDGICRVNCTSYNCNSNGVCDSGEGCQCADCNNQQSSCMVGSTCKLQGANCLYAPNLNVCTPALDMCNGKDDNCNGQTDEDCKPTVRDIYVNTTKISPNSWVRVYCDISTGLPESTMLASIYFGPSSNNWIINNVVMWWDPVKKDHYYDYFVDVISNVTSVYYLRCDAVDVYGNSASLTRTTGFTVSTYCGDGNCGSGESCSSCSVDCGSCPTDDDDDDDSSGGSGSSSGSSRKTYTVDFTLKDVYSYDNLRENDRFIMNFPGKNKKYVLEIQDEFSSETEFDLDDGSNFRISKNSNKNLDVDSDGKNDVDVEVGDISNYRPDMTFNYLKPAGVVCGDSKCDISESCLTCSTDCGTCKTQASCADGISNQGEDGVDCGGPCLRDCATCYDGISNQGEEGVDCGGPCSSCAYCGDGTCDKDEDSCSCKDDCEKERLASWITPFLILIILAGITGFLSKKFRDRSKGIMEDLRKKGEWDKPTNSNIRGEIIYKLRFWSRMFYVVIGLIILAGLVLVYYLGICNDCKNGWVLSVILLILIALLSLIYGLYKKYGNPKRRTITLADAEKIIRNAIKKGYKPDQIKKLAIDQGWTVDTINRILDKIKSEDGNKR